jgi:hypothetical protein
MQFHRKFWRQNMGARNMRATLIVTVLSGVFLAAASDVAGFGGAAAAQQSVPPVSLPAAPTVKVLAIGHLTAAAMAPGAMKPVMPSEVRETVKLYLGGKIDSWYVRQDKPGVVFLMNVSTVEEAHALLEALPLGQKGLMEFDLIPLGPLTPLSLLVNGPAGGGK